MRIAEFLKLVNRERRKGDWYFFEEEVNGSTVYLKGYGTWVQRLTYKSVVDGSTMGMLVGEFNEYLRTRLS
jgi:hypothetical protein